MKSINLNLGSLERESSNLDNSSKSYKKLEHLVPEIWPFEH